MMAEQEKAQTQVAMDDYVPWVPPATPSSESLSESTTSSGLALVGFGRG